MKQKIYMVPFMVACLMGGISAAHADNLKIYSPRVDKGELSVEDNINYSVDKKDPENDNYLSQVVGAEYGVTDWWQTELSGEIEKDNASSNQLTNIKFENIFAPWKPGENFIDTAFYLELEKAALSGDPNNFEAKLLLEKNIDNFVNTANIKVNHEFGPNAESGWGTGLALRTKYRLDPKFEPGIEYYGEFGNTKESLSFNEQSHAVGPVIQGKLGKVKYDTGVLFGVSDSAPDTTAKFNIEYEF